MIITPDIILYNTIEGILKLIRLDWRNTSTKEDTLLYKLLYGVNYAQYDLYEQSQKVFLRDDDDPNLIQVKMSFDAGRKDQTTIYINLPGETTKDNGIGIDQGFGDAEFNERTSPSDQLSNATYRTTFTRRFSAMYSVVVMSPNRNEVLLVYNVLKALLIPLIEHLNQSGLENVEYSGKDLQIQIENVPQHMFMRAIGIQFAYDFTVPNIDLKSWVTNLEFVGKGFTVDSNESEVFVTTEQVKSDNGVGIGNAFYQLGLAQSFVPKDSGKVKKVSLQLYKQGDPTDKVYVKIAKDNFENVILTSKEIQVFQFDVAPGKLVDFIFDDDSIEVDDTSVYYIKLFRTGEIDVHNGVGWMGLYQNTINYNGQAYRLNQNDSVWRTLPNLSVFQFKVYLTN